MAGGGGGGFRRGAGAQEGGEPGGGAAGTKKPVRRRSCEPAHQTSEGIPKQPSNASGDRNAGVPLTGCGEGRFPGCARVLGDGRWGPSPGVCWVLRPAHAHARTQARMHARTHSREFESPRAHRPTPPPLGSRCLAGTHLALRRRSSQSRPRPRPGRPWGPNWVGGPGSGGGRAVGGRARAGRGGRDEAGSRRT